MRYVILICLMACMSACNNKMIKVDIVAPDCIKKMITGFEQEPRQNPPRKILRYRYKGNIVYYVPPICCDMYSDLYTSDCSLLGHPDGGITGNGDGTLPDFNAEKKEEQLVWEDKR